MRISEVELIPIKAKNGLTFFASCILDDKYFVGNLAVFTRRDGSGFRVVYPTKLLKNGTQIPIFYPINSKVGNKIQKAISDKATQLLTPSDYQLVNEEVN